MGSEMCIRDRGFSVRFLQHELRRRWRIDDGFEILVLAHCFYAFKLKSEKDQRKVLGGVPWLVAGQPLALEKWKTDFQPKEEMMPLVSGGILVYGGKYLGSFLMLL